MARQDLYPDHEGGCLWCDKDAVIERRLCPRHLLMARRTNRLYRRAVTHSQPWQPGRPGRPPKSLTKV